MQFATIKRCKGAAHRHIYTGLTHPRNLRLVAAGGKFCVDAIVIQSHSFNQCELLSFEPSWLGNYRFDSK
jgi:hypothetical protein